MNDPHQIPVAVIGLSGGDLEQSQGVGKSSFCSRFVRPAFDDYALVKDGLSSCISEAEFLQREVNRCHFLYFSPPVVDKIQLHVVEHTILLSDTTFQPFPEAGKYGDRATRQFLRSDGKVAFVTRDDIGHRSDTKWFPCELFERVGIKGYICLFDSTLVEEAVERQESLIRNVMTKVRSKNPKTPIILAVSKCDKAKDDGIGCAKQVANDFSVPITFTSAHQNLNVSETFMMLANLILRIPTSNFSRPEQSDYASALEYHKEKLRAVDRDYNELLKRLVRGLYITWSYIQARLEGRPEYENFTFSFGKVEAKVAFKTRIMLTALRTSEELIHSLVQGNQISGRQDIIRDLLLEHDDIGHMGFSLYKEVNNYCHSHYRYFGTEDEQAIDEVLMLLKELTLPFEAETENVDGVNHADAAAAENETDIVMINGPSVKEFDYSTSNVTQNNEDEVITHL
jgi:GTPase SAR1 family protein